MSGRDSASSRDWTPLEEAIHRKLRSLDPNATNALERDAEALARIVIRHWGDQASQVLERARQIASDQLAKWGARPPEMRDRRLPTSGEGD